MKKLIILLIFVITLISVNAQYTEFNQDLNTTANVIHEKFTTERTESPSYYEYWNSVIYWNRIEKYHEYDDSGDSGVVYQIYTEIDDTGILTEKSYENDTLYTYESCELNPSVIRCYDNLEIFFLMTNDTFQYKGNDVCIDEGEGCGSGGGSTENYYNYTYYSMTDTQFNTINDTIKDLKGALTMLGLIILWLGLWYLGYYAMQTGNELLSGTMIFLTLPIDIYFAYIFRESLFLGTAYIGIAMGFMFLWTIGVFILIKRKIPRST